ncbi:MAG: Gfo/Idh/MocA family oxidoreductase [Firmicutes bacterium]|nr:Gfo/Idh/MocA family oxidoreductase [Bacillota bacterium]
MKKLKIGIIGLGAISNTHIFNIKKYKDAEIVGIYDIQIERAVSASLTHQIPYVQTFQELLDLHPDVVHVLTPHDTHYEIVKELLNNHIHVLAEKPLTIDYLQAIELAEIAADKEVILSVCLQNRTNKTTKKMIELKNSKPFGKLLSSRGLVYWKRDMNYYKQSSWRGTKNHEGGGVLINQAIHTLDILTLLGGEIDFLYGSYFNYLLPEIEVEDNVQIVIKFKNQSLGFLSATNNYPVDSPVEIDLIFEKGRFKLIGDTLYQLTEEGLEVIEKDSKTIGEKFYFGASHENLIHDLYDYILYGYGSVVQAKDTITSLEIINKVYENPDFREKIFLDTSYFNKN